MVALTLSVSIQIWQEHIIPHIVIIEIGDVQHSLGAHLIAMHHHGSLFRSLRCIEIDGMGLVARRHRDKGILHAMVLIHRVHPANHPWALVLHSVLPMLSCHSLLLRIVERIIEHIVAGAIQAQHHKHHQAQSRSDAYLSHPFLFYLLHFLLLLHISRFIQLYSTLNKELFIFLLTSFSTFWVFLPKSKE